MSVEAVVAMLVSALGSTVGAVVFMYKALNAAHAQNYARMEAQYEVRLAEKDKNCRELITEWREREQEWRAQRVFLETQIGRGVGVAEAVVKRDQGRG